MSPLGDGIHLIDALYQRPGVVAFYLVVAGGRAAFVDTGTAHAQPQALAALAACGLGPEAVDYVIPTHVHLDHAGGAGAMMQRFPNAQVVVHPRGAPHLIDPARLIDGATAVYGADTMARMFGTIVPVAAERVVEAPDEYVLSVGDRRLRLLDTPGHARHHLCVVDEASGSIFTGDTFGISYRAFDGVRGAFIFPAATPTQFDPQALHGSIDRLLAERPRQILLTHFGAVTEVERLGADLHQCIDAYVAMAKAVPVGPGRHAALVDGQRAIVTRLLRQQGCSLAPAAVEQVLADDYELNAQGLAVWLDRGA